MPDLLQMLGNMFLFPGNQRQIEKCVHGQVPLAPDEPGGGVVRAAQRGDCERTGMNTQFQLLAFAAFQDVKIERHAVDQSNSRSKRRAALKGLRYPACVS